MNNKASHEKNREKRIAAARAWRAENPEKDKQNKRAWQEKNHEKSLTRRRALHAENREEENARSRQRHALHREEANASRRKWNADNPERAQETRARYLVENRDKVLAKKKVDYRCKRESFLGESLLRGARGRAIKRNLPFDLTKEWIEARWTGRCEISDIPFALRDGIPGPKFYSPSIDRKEAILGYTQANCRIVLWAVNALKHDGTDADMYLVAKALYKKSLIQN